MTDVRKNLDNLQYLFDKCQFEKYADWQSDRQAIAEQQQTLRQLLGQLDPITQYRILSDGRFGKNVALNSPDWFRPNPTGALAELKALSENVQNAIDTAEQPFDGIMRIHRKDGTIAEVPAIKGEDGSWLPLNAQYAAYVQRGDMMRGRSLDADYIKKMTNNGEYGNGIFSKDTDVSQSHLERVKAGLLDGYLNKMISSGVPKDKAEQAVAQIKQSPEFAQMISSIRDNYTQNADAAFENAKLIEQAAPLAVAPIKQVFDNKLGAMGNVNAHNAIQARAAGLSLTPTDVPGYYDHQKSKIDAMTGNRISKAHQWLDNKLDWSKELSQGGKKYGDKIHPMVGDAAAWVGNLAGSLPTIANPLSLGDMAVDIVTGKPIADLASDVDEHSQYRGPTSELLGVGHSGDLQFDKSIDPVLRQIHDNINLATRGYANAAQAGTGGNMAVSAGKSLLSYTPAAAAKGVSKLPVVGKLLNVAGLTGSVPLRIAENKALWKKVMANPSLAGKIKGTASAAGVAAMIPAAPTFGMFIPGTINGAMQNLGDSTYVKDQLHDAVGGLTGQDMSTPGLIDSPYEISLTAQGMQAAKLNPENPLENITDKDIRIRENNLNTQEGWNSSLIAPDVQGLQDTNNSIMNKYVNPLNTPVNKVINTGNSLIDKGNQLLNKGKAMLPGIKNYVKTGLNQTADFVKNNKPLAYGVGAAGLLGAGYLASNYFKDLYRKKQYEEMMKKRQQLLSNNNGVLY